MFSKSRIGDIVKHFIFFSKITLLLYFQLSKYLSKDTYMSVDKSSDKIRKYTSFVYSFYVEVKMGNIPQQSTYVNQYLNGTKNYGNLETDA